MEVILKDWQGKWDLGEKSGERSWEIGDRVGGGKRYEIRGSGKTC